MSSPHTTHFMINHRYHPVTRHHRDRRATVCVMGNNKPDRDPKDAAQWAKVDDLIAQIDKADQAQREAAEKANRDNR